MSKKNIDKKLIAYNRLKEFILDYHIGPGQRLEHDYLSKEIGVSHTPIREALNQLLEEGYVHQIKNRGYFVCELSPDEINELYELREALEVYALKKTMNRKKSISPKTLDNLKRLFDNYADSVQKGIHKNRLFLDQEIHITLGKQSGNQSLVKHLYDIFERINYKRRVVGLYPERGPEASAEHFELFENMQNKDVENALNCLSCHIIKGKEKLLALLQERADEIRYYNERRRIERI